MLDNLRWGQLRSDTTPDNFPPPPTTSEGGIHREKQRASLAENSSPDNFGWARTPDTFTYPPPPDNFPGVPTSRGEEASRWAGPRFPFPRPEAGMSLALGTVLTSTRGAVGSAGAAHSPRRVWRSPVYCGRVSTGGLVAEDGRERRKGGG